MLGQTPERIAWITLLGAQLVCIAVTALAFGSGYWFFLESHVNLQANMEVGRGTTTVISRNGDEAVRTTRNINDNELVTTDENSQSTIQFIDTSNGNMVIANVTIRASSQARLSYATRARFNFTDSDYNILLDNILGKVEIEIPHDLPHDIQLHLRGNNGELRLYQAGFYVLTSLTDSNMKIWARRGIAQVKPYGGDLTQIGENQTALVNGIGQITQVGYVTEELVRNPFLEPVPSSDSNTPDQWGCNEDTAEGAPNGQFTTRQREGHDVVAIKRDGADYSRVSCFQELAVNGDYIDVTRFRSLRIRATMEIIWQSLTLCGEQASECPLMLQLTYRTASGTTQDWYYGFYAYEYQGVPVLRRTCESCRSEHIQTRPGNWFIFESNNLLVELPNDPALDLRPVKLERIYFYSSGHAYDVNVSEISIIGEY